MGTHPLDQATDLVAATEPGHFVGRTHPAYANMVGPFGGTTAATLLHGVLRHPELIGEPVAVTVNFVGPVADGEFEVVAVPTRTNRSTQHWYVEQRQGGAVVSTATVATAQRRPSLDDTEHLAPEVPGAEDVPALVGPLPVRWAGSYRMQFVRGLPAATPSPTSESVLWVRDEPPRPLDALSLVAMCDIFFPRVYQRTGAFGPAGTVSLTVYLHASAEQLAARGSEELLGRARAQRFGGGYFDQAVQLWDRGGTLLATSHQLVYFKA